LRTNARGEGGQRYVPRGLTACRMVTANGNNRKMTPCPLPTLEAVDDMAEGVHLFGGLTPRWWAPSSLQLQLHDPASPPTPLVIPPTLGATQLATEAMWVAPGGSEPRVRVDGVPHQHAEQPPQSRRLRFPRGPSAAPLPLILLKPFLRLLHRRPRRVELAVISARVTIAIFALDIIAAEPQLGL
jgi:hypothetical protein